MECLNIIAFFLYKTIRTEIKQKIVAAKQHGIANVACEVLLHEIERRLVRYSNYIPSLKY